MTAQPNYYNKVQALGNATTSGDTLDFLDQVSQKPFEATLLRLYNYETAIDIYVNMSGRGNKATTTDLRVRACSDLGWAPVPRISSITAYTTSTSAADKLLGVVALGG